jgi:hypothetical protein
MTWPSAGYSLRDLKPGRRSGIQVLPAMGRVNQMSVPGEFVRTKTVITPPGNGGVNAGIPLKLRVGRASGDRFRSRGCWLSSDLVPASVSGAALFDRLQNREAGI